MSSVDVSELIERAAIAANMHDNFATNPAWLFWANVENKELRVKLARLGFPYGLDSETITITGAIQYNITEPLAVLGVYRNETDGRFTRIAHRPNSMKLAQNITTTGDAREFMLGYDATSSQVYIRFYPTPPDSGPNYTIEVISNPAKLVLESPAAGESTTVYYPLNWEERIVLGMARRALAREETINSGIENLIKEMDSHIETSAYDYLMSQNNVVQRISTGDQLPYFIFP
jgi:hypothetical protein